MKLENMEMKNLRGPGLPVHSHSGGGLVQSASLRHSDPGFDFCDYCVDIANTAQYCPSLHFPSVRVSAQMYIGIYAIRITRGPIKLDK